MSDPHELSAPRDPGSYGRARGSGLGFWALIAFGLVCLAVGYGAARFGPQLYPAKPGLLDQRRDRGSNHRAAGRRRFHR